MKGLLNRRRFVRIFFGAFVPDRRDPITWFDADTFVVESGCLSCIGQRQPDGCWDLEFTVWRITRIVPVMETVERMNPTEALRQRLLESGIPTDFAGHEIFRSLVGRVSAGTTPEELLRVLRHIGSRFTEGELGCPVPDLAKTRRTGEI